MTPSSNVKITRDGAVLCVTFDRPDKKNALNRAMYLAATGALRQAGGDRSMGAVVFAGAGGVFTAGNDIADFLEARRARGISGFYIHQVSCCLRNAARRGDRRHCRRHWRDDDAAL
jgi:enoyl-CoA hydratase/carnithine racemase